MKKRWAPLLILLLLWLSDCSFGDIKLPTLTLTINSETVDHRLGIYTWSTGRRGVVADAAAPPLLVKELKLHPAAPSAKLHVQFDYCPAAKRKRTPGLLPVFFVSLGGLHHAAHHLLIYIKLFVCL
ncbi:UNVERIFIED_ORG: hypothetical protein BDK47_13311 [Anoxybacillus amylolyticus]